MAELHRPRNGRLGQVSRHSHRMPVTLEVLPNYYPAVETPSNGHLTHQYSSCQFSRICPAGKMGTLQELNSPRTVSAAPRADCFFTIRTGIARRAQWVLPPTPFMWARNPIPPPEPSSRPSIRPP